MSYLGFSRRWAAKLAETHQLDGEKQSVLAYAIEIITLNMLNVIFALLLGWLLGVFWNTLACLLTIAAFRYNAGGGHSESPWRCGLMTIIIFPLLALAAGYVSTWSGLYTDILSLAAIGLGLVFVEIYAPVEDPKAPIVSPARRKRLKNWARLIMVLLALIIIGLRFGGGGKAAEIQMCLTLSLLWVSFNITPWGHRLWCFIDGIKI
ncbi:MAG: accessory gene regulator B family protein [Desulfotomaculaceae bacterium]|nr:accessory gene regulator B family protein [Desulfotomaculaceae bacterium]